MRNYLFRLVTQQSASLDDHRMHPKYMSLHSSAFMGATFATLNQPTSYELILFVCEQREAGKTTQNPPTLLLLHVLALGDILFYSSAGFARSRVCGEKATD